MIEEIKGIVRDQIKLIEPIAKSGATSSIRKTANDIIDKLYNITDSTLSLEDFIKNFRNELIECCSSLYIKLSDDSRTASMFSLREISKTESERIMNIWKFIENK